MVADMIQFDDIDEWAPDLSSALALIVSESVRQRLIRAELQYIEDAREFVLAESGRDTLIDAVLRWLESRDIVCYHGTRLTEGELESVQSLGLVPLVAAARRDRLARALSRHPMWQQASDRLPSVLASYGPGGVSGVREGQVHLTLSRAGLTESFNHYLIRGSEFDQRVAAELLGDDGRALLASDGHARVIQVAVPGRIAILAAHPFFPVDTMRDRGEIPNLVAEFLASWSFKQAHPAFQSKALRMDCGLFFREAIPAEWIVGIETVPDSPLAVG